MQRRLYRSEKDRMIFGVCGGLAEYFDIDPVLVRLIFLLLLIPGGVGLLAYIILAIVTPTESKVSLPPREAARESIREMAEEVKGVGEELRDAFRGPGSGQEREEAARPARWGGRELAGIVLILLGITFLLDQLFPWFELEKLWPLILIVIGLALLLRRRTT